MYIRDKRRRRKRSYPGPVQENQQKEFTPRVDRKLQNIFQSIGIPDVSPFIADDFQLEALEKIDQTDVLVSAPTGSGKTWIAVQAIRRVLAEGRRAWYASPLKALSNSKYHEFIEEFGSGNVGVLTGDRKENGDAPVIVGTTEILRNQLYDAMNNAADFRADLVVLDEAHYLGDTDRGVVWEEVMIYLPPRVRLLMLSATIQNDREVAAWLTVIRKHLCQVVHSEKRPVPIYPLYLLPDGELLPLSGFDGITPKIEIFLGQTEKKFRRFQQAVSYDRILEALDRFNLLPAIFFLKSRAECNNALRVCSRRAVSPKKAQSIAQRLEELFVDYPFLAKHPHLTYVQSSALGAHHGGQLPHWKIVVEKLMNEGYLDAIFSTSTVAAGVNFPARTVVLVQSDRFNGKGFVSLSATDLHQATGRAGRRGKDKIGFAVMVHGPFQDPHLLDELFSNRPDPIDSQIKINFSMVLNLLLGHSPDEVHKLLDVSFATYQKIDSLQGLEDQREKALVKLSGKLEGCRCANLQEIMETSEKHQLWTKQLSRAKKKKKHYLKGCFKAEIDTDGDAKVQELNSRIEYLTDGLAKLPCGGCSNFGLCFQGKNNHFLKLVEKAQYLDQTLDGARNLLWSDFTRHLDFLILKGFAEPGGRLTEDGVWASMLRLDQPLIIAELIRMGFFNDMTPELLSGVIAVFVNDKFRDIDINPEMRWNKKPIIEAYMRMKDLTDGMLDNMKEHGFSVPQLQFWPAAALFTWAGGEAWENVIRLTGVDEGDLAMLIYRTADNLRQIASLEKTHPGLAEKARRTIDLLLREPVVIPT